MATAARPLSTTRKPRTAARKTKSPQPEPGSRDRLFAAAAAEFAARGFAGANVDRIARAAGVNKAMIYYHFHSKAALYQEILGEMFHAVGERIRAVAASDATPEQKLEQFVAAIAEAAEARPHFPPIWFREIAEEGAHLGPATMQEVAGIVQGLIAILQEGIRARRFRKVNPLLVHGGIVGPLLLFLASAGLRRRLENAGVPGAAQFTRDEVVAHVQRVTLALVEGRM
jgi:TetR/AcrR family transcriptional regulator